MTRRRMVLMRRLAVIGVLLCAGAVAVPAGISAASDRVSTNPGVAALQVALRARGAYRGPIDGIAGPGTKAAVVTIQQSRGLAPDGVAGPATRRVLGPLGRPLLGQRPLTVGQRGWDVASLEFRLRAYGLPHRAVDGRFTPATAAALRRFQEKVGLTPDGIAGPLTFRALARGKVAAPPKARHIHVVTPGEGLILIAREYGVGVIELAGANGLTLRSVIVPGQRLGIPTAAGARARCTSSSRARAGSSSRSAIASARTTSRS